MATGRWNSGKDVLKDLDELSSFTEGRNVPSLPILGFGRGKPISDHRNEEYYDPFEDESDLPLFHNGIGRGQKLEAMVEGSLRDGNSDILEKHLRLAMGKGYSNEQIERDWGHGYEPNEPQSDCFADAEDIRETSEGASKESTEENTSLENTVTDAPSKVTCDSPSKNITDVEVPKKSTQRPRKRRCKNALLNSLGVTCSPEFVSESNPTKSDKTPPRLIPSECTQNSVPSSAISKDPSKMSLNSSSANECGSRMSAHAPEFVPRQTIECKSTYNFSEPFSNTYGVHYTGFEYRVDDFPPLSSSIKINNVEIKNRLKM